MQPELLPLFPLAIVLFPRVHLPLHIFEDRYKEMIGTAIQDKSEIGIVLSEDHGVANSGCTAVVESVVQRYEDGRLDVMTVGLRRFEILELDNESSYLRGSVTYFNDDETVSAPEDLTKQAMAGYRELRGLLRDQEEESEPVLSDPQLSFQLAQAIPDLSFRQHLLTCRSEAHRIEMLAEFLPRHVSQQRHIRHIRDVAPSNGHGPTSIPF